MTDKKDYTPREPIHYKRFRDIGVADETLRRLFVEAADGSYGMYGQMSVMEVMNYTMAALGMDASFIQSRLIRAYPTLPRGLPLSAHMLTLMTLEDLYKNEDVHPDHWPNIDDIDPQYHQDVDAEFSSL